MATSEPTFLAQASRIVRLPRVLGPNMALQGTVEYFLRSLLSRKLLIAIVLVLYNLAQNTSIQHETWGMIIASPINLIGVVYIIGQSLVDATGGA